MDLTIRRALATDIPAMHRIRLDVTENRLSDPEQVTEESYRAYVEQGGAWVAEIAGQIAGFAIVDRPAQSLWALFVQAAMEGQGIARALFQTATDWSAGQGLECLWLVTTPGTRAERFYDAAGLKKLGVTDVGEVRFELNLAGHRI